MHRSTKIFLNSLFLLFLLVACSPNSSKPPIAVDQMQEILKEVHFAEAYSSLLGGDSLYRAYSGKNIDSLAVFYQQIMKQHNISIEQFDSALSWYSLHPQLLDTVYAKLLPIYDSMKAIKAPEITNP